MQILQEQIYVRRALKIKKIPRNLGTYTINAYAEINAKADMAGLPKLWNNGDQDGLGANLANLLNHYWQTEAVI